MTMDKSLRTSGALKRSRNVLTRYERIVALEQEDRWNSGESPFGLPKVRVRRTAAGKKKSKEKEEAAEAAVPEERAAEESAAE